MALQLQTRRRALLAVLECIQQVGLLLVHRAQKAHSQVLLDLQCVPRVNHQGMLTHTLTHLECLRAYRAQPVQMENGRVAVAATLQGHAIHAVTEVSKKQCVHNIKASAK